MDRSLAATSLRVYQVADRPPMLVVVPLALQHLLCMFGATVLVPMLLKADPGICLLMNGIGTLIYLAMCKWQIPAYLGSSFAFIAPTLAVMQAFPGMGMAAAQGGYIIFGLSFVIAGLLVLRFGQGWISFILPDAAMGALIAVIGLELAPVAAQMAGFVGENISRTDQLIAAVSFFGTVLAAGGNFRRLSAFPVLIGVLCGCATAHLLGVTNWSEVSEAAWLVLPQFSLPVWDTQAVLMILPATMVVLAEHVGHLLVTGEVIGSDLTKSPGLHRSLMADGLSNVLSGFTGATPNTTYGENIGVMALTRVYSTFVLGTAACLAILMAFVGKLAAIIRAIPTPVMGGVSLILFGIIAAAGVRMLTERRIDFSRPTNLILTSVVLVIGCSGMKLMIGGIEWKGMALAALTGLILNLVLRLLTRVRPF
jgi:uracil permease